MYRIYIKEGYSTQYTLSRVVVWCMGAETDQGTWADVEAELTEIRQSQTEEPGRNFPSSPVINDL